MHQPADTPESLFERFRRAADAAALAAVFDAVAPELLLVAAHVARAHVPTGNGAPEDLVQATFLDAIEKRDRWDASRPLLPWLLGILVNHARLERRRSARAVDPEKLADRLGDRASPSPLDELAAAEAGELVAAALRGLPRHLRQTLTLRLVHGLTPTQIAHALGCPVATVKTRLQRGLAALRRMLPAGVAAGLAALVADGRALAAVRDAVLAAAQRLVPLPAATAASAATSVVSAAAAGIAGGMLMKKVVLAVLAAVAAVVVWTVVPAPPEPDVAPPHANAAPQLAQAAAPRAPELAGEPAAQPAAPRRDAVAPADARATGALALTFVWKGLDTPAAHLRVSWFAAAASSASSTPATADAAGRLRLDDLAPGDYTLFGRTLSHRTTVRPGATTEECVEVEPSLRVDGIVVDPAGRGVAGAAVEVQYFPDIADTTPRRVATTRDDGTFAGAADAGGWVWAHRDGFAPSRAATTGPEGGSAHLRLVLDVPGTALQGVVRAADGAPAAGAAITIVRTAERDVCAPPVVLRCDGRGRFATDEVAPGAHLLVAQHDGSAATPLPFTVVAGEPQVLDVRLARGAELRGTVRDTNGTPLRARLGVRPEFAGAFGGFLESLRPIYHLGVVTAKAGADGTFVLANVPPGRAVLEVQPHDAAVGDSQELALQDGERRTLDLVLGTGGALRGRVVAPDGSPLADWNVFFAPVPRDAGPGTMAATDADGVFAIAGLAADAYDLRAMPQGSGIHLPWAAAPGVRTGQQDVVLRATCTAAMAGTFAGVLHDGAGNVPVAGQAIVTPAGTVQGTMCHLQLGEDGAFELGPLPPGDWSIVVRTVTDGGARGDGVHVGTHTLRAGERADLGDVRIPATGTMELCFRTPGGAAVDPAQLYVGDAAFNRASFERQGDGVLHSQPLPEGTYRVSAWGEGFLRVDAPAVVVAERTTRTDLVVQPACAVHVELRRTTAAAATAANATSPWRASLEVADAAGKVLESGLLPGGDGDVLRWSRGLPPGRYTATGKLAPDGTAVRVAFEVAAGAAELRVPIELPASGG